MKLGNLVIWSLYRPRKYYKVRSMETCSTTFYNGYGPYPNVITTALLIIICIQFVSLYTVTNHTPTINMKYCTIEYIFVHTVGCSLISVI